MFCTSRSAFLLLIAFSTTPFCIAQSPPVIFPLSLTGDPQATKAAPFGGLSDTQCDDAGNIYVHYVTRQSDSFSFSSGVTKIQSDGRAEKIAMDNQPDSGPVHVFQFAAAQDGSLHEIARARKFNSPDAPTEVYYVTFDSDGTFHSREPFEKEFIPTLLLPLPGGDFFAMGVTTEEKEDEVQEKPLAGIFGPDAKLKWALQKKADKPAAQSRAKDPTELGEDSSPQGTAAVLGADGNIYVLFDGSDTKIEVVTQRGRVARKLTLQLPAGMLMATGIWVSGGRILVAYDGESDDPKTAHMYALYDAQTGQNVRLYRPDFFGTPVCFVDGQSVTVLMSESRSGAVELGEANLQ
jgi:hypothetical protein